MNTTWEQTERLLPILVHIQANLEENLALDQIADRAQVSPFHFHRQFQNVVGETLKQYTQRLRLERAAYYLKIRDATVLDIALTCGFHNHETFSRAFKRHFGLTPRAFRQQGGLLSDRPLIGVADNQPSHALNHHTTRFELSKVQVQTLNPLHVAFIRHIGPYTEVDATAFDRLVAWAKATGVYDGDNLLLAIGHDDPNITPPEKLRYDACLSVKRPFSPQGEIGYQIIPAAAYGTATYIGPYGPTMFEAIATIFNQLAQLKRYQIVGLPLIEIYRTTQINPDYELNQTDIYIPVSVIKEL
ncbi:MAG: GyrI-like domain-containing protein [Chloroflexota bacterium]